MTAGAVAGVLGVRQHGCAADEPIRLCVESRIEDVRFDVPGVPWDGHRHVAGERQLSQAVEYADVLLTGEQDVSDQAPPSVVVFGAAAAEAPSAVLHRSAVGGAGSWVLTPARLAWFEHPAPPTGQPTDSSWRGRARRALAGAGELTQDIGDILRDKPFARYPPHEPLPVVESVARIEFPTQRIGSIDRRSRQLPAGYRPRTVDALRIELVDGSGVEFPHASDDIARRMHVMALGQS